jgi:hypothetical protein
VERVNGGGELAAEGGEDVASAAIRGEAVERVNGRCGNNGEVGRGGAYRRRCHGVRAASRRAAARGSGGVRRVSSSSWGK